jgi:hypothetical protein
MCLATAIASAAWLISNQEYTETANMMSNEQAAATSNPAPSTPAMPTAPAEPVTSAASAQPPAAADASLTANATAATTNAAQAAQRSSAKPAQSVHSASSAPAAPSAAGQRAFIDPVTGQLRQPEHDELAALAAEAAANAGTARRSAARTATAAAATEFYGADGSVEAVVPEDLHTFTVATRGPDGRIVVDHAQGRKAADKLVKANSAKKPRASVSHAQKEDRNDR